MYQELLKVLWRYILTFGLEQESREKSKANEAIYTFVAVDETGGIS